MNHGVIDKLPNTTLLEYMGSISMSIMTQVSCFILLLDFVPVCKEEPSPKQEEMGSRLFQKEPESQQIKEEGEELFQIQEDLPLEADGTLLTLLAVKSEDVENRETDHPASTSYACIEDCITPKPTSDAQLLSSHCSESDTDDSEDWEKTSEGHSALNTLKSCKINVIGQRLSLSNKSQNPKSSKQTHTMSHHTGKLYSRTNGLVCTHLVVKTSVGWHV